MITIEQLLESVDLDFEPRWVTKDENGNVNIWSEKPYRRNTDWDCELVFAYATVYEGLKLAEFDGKDWTECIYEVPRKINPTKLIGKLCIFGKGAPDEKYGILAEYDPESKYPFFIKGYEDWYMHCAPVRPDDDVIYKGE